jgi:hypothetical protein
MSLVALLCAALAPAASAMKLTAIDIMTSTVMQEGQSSFSGVAARARLTSPIFIQGIEFMPTMEYWRNANSLEPFGINTARKDATIAIDVRYSLKTTGTKPYLGAGYGVHFLSSSVNAPTLGINDESQALTKGGFGLLGGVSFPLTQKIENFLELKYHHVSGYRQLKFNWGLAINL